MSQPISARLSNTSYEELQKLIESYRNEVSESPVATVTTTSVLDYCIHTTYTHAKGFLTSEQKDEILTNIKETVNLRENKDNLDFILGMKLMLHYFSVSEVISKKEEADFAKSINERIDSILGRTDKEEEKNEG